MPTKKYKWTQIDASVSKMIADMMRASNKTDRGLADEMGIDISYNRVRDLRLGLKAPARLTEFIAICRACNCDPAQKLRELLEPSLSSFETAVKAESIVDSILASNMKLVANRDDNKYNEMEDY